MSQKCYIFAMKWSELKKLAISKGWLLKQHGKRHDIYYHPQKDYEILIERHWSKELKNGIYYNLIKLL